MTPKEKAFELFDKMFLIIENKGMYDDLYRAKQCALIAVDEMIAELAYIRNYDEEIDEKMIIKIDQRQDFLIEVEKEIEAL
jgi:hypothetical protein